MIESLKARAPLASILDIGMGAGRTTRHFAPLFDHYTGLDFSATMVDHCKKTFVDNKNLTFVNADACNMHMLKTASFDFVMFSFNGIDCIPAVDRTKVLAEIHRVLKPGGIFFFSFHSSYNIARLFSFQMPRNPLKYAGELRRMRGVRKHNPPVESLMTKDFVQVIDGDMNFGSSLVYSKPVAQVQQLASMGFVDIELFRLKTGNPVPVTADWNTINDAWIHVACKTRR
jgi:SAM-dependent methyltransferase